MNQNLEVKAIIPSVSEVIPIAVLLNAIYCDEFFQIDTYFRVPTGRLKLREINNERAELIYYDRKENSHVRLSDFIRYPSTAPLLLKEMLVKANGVVATVAKKRLLYMYQDTRIHIDTIEHLGSFIEFETPVADSLEKAQEMIRYLCVRFGIGEKDFINHSYVDLFVEKVKS